MAAPIPFGGASNKMDVRSLRSLPFLFSASGSSKLDRLFQTKMPRLGGGDIHFVCGEGGIAFGDPLLGGLKTSSWHLQTAEGRLRFLFSTSGSSELDRLLRTKNPQRLRCGCHDEVLRRGRDWLRRSLLGGGLRPTAPPPAPRAGFFVAVRLRERARAAPLHKKSTPANWRGLCCCRSCGEGGIRTLDTSLSSYNGLANRPFRPLRHLSEYPSVLHGGPQPDIFERGGKNKD